MIPSIFATSFCVLGTIVTGILWYIYRNKKWKRFIIVTYIFVFASAVSIPFLINELYKTNSGYATLWEAKDVLYFYGSFLAFLGTVALGALALWQNKKANEISENLLINEIIRNSCVIDFDDDINEPYISIKNYIDGSGKGLYIRYKNFGNIDIISHTVTVSFINPTKNKELLVPAIDISSNAFLRRSGTNSVTVKLPTLPGNILQLLLHFEFTTAFRQVFAQNLTAQFIICEDNVLDPREKYIFFFDTTKEASINDKS